MNQTNQSIDILFYLRESKKKKTGQAPIYCRVTVKGKRAEFSIKRSVLPEYWNKESNTVKGKSRTFKLINKHIDATKFKLREIENSFIHLRKPVSSKEIVKQYKGKEDTIPTVVDLFTSHNNKMLERVGIEFALATHKRYETTLKHLQEFMLHKYNNSDYSLSELKYSFITDFDHYLRTIRKCNNNSTVKYISNFRKIINSAVAKDLLVKDPFLLYKKKLIKTKVTYLTQEELYRIENKQFSIDRLNRVRDVFIFSCYTGLAYIDLLNLTKDNIQIGIDKKLWIDVYRQKTQERTNLPLFAKAIEILEKYKDDPECEILNKLLPIKSNQKMNAYLKEIADLCGITKNLTFHQSRHTFATTVTLTNGVGIEVVSKMMGHKNLKSTQRYARVVASRISKEMMKLEEHIEEEKLKREQEDKENKEAS